MYVLCTSVGMTTLRIHHKTFSVIDYNNELKLPQEKRPFKRSILPTRAKHPINNSLFGYPHLTFVCNGKLL